MKNVVLNNIDGVLNNYTMYRVVVYGLSTLLAVACVLGSTGVISINALPLIISTIVLVASCYATNKALAITLHVPTNTESWLISALILVCILPPADSVSRALYVALTGLLAMASKFILTYKGSSFLNPAAFGTFVVSIAGLLPSTWWVATPWLTPFTVLLALVVLRKQRRFQLFFVFAFTALAMLILTGTILQGTDIATILRNATLSWPIIFFGSIMLTEPATLPPTRYYQLLLAIITGLLFTSQLHAGRITTTPQAVLLFGNILVLLSIPAYGALLKLREIRRLSPEIYEVSFDRPPSLHFTPGQYAELTLPYASADSRGNRRTFSIASPASASDIRFAFRTAEKGSSFKAVLTNMQPGKVLRLSHIAGDFTLPKGTSRPLLFIAGGIGVTPFHSMIGSLTTKRNIVLIYVSSNPQNFVYKDDFDQATAYGVRTVYMQDRLTVESLRAQVPDVEQRLIYLSGPDRMVRGYTELLEKMGVKHRNLRMDHFSGY